GVGMTARGEDRGLEEIARLVARPPLALHRPAEVGLQRKGQVHDAHGRILARGPQCCQCAAIAAASRYLGGVETTESATPLPAGIGGWLMLVAVALCLTPIRIAAELLATLRPLNSALWHALTTPGTRAYHPLFAPWIVGQLVVYSVLLLWALGLLYLFFAKK